MTKLAPIRSRLARIRRRRRAVRLVAAMATIGFVVLAVLAGAFGLDWLFEMSQMQRVVLAAIALCVVGWAAKRFAMPLVSVRESDLDVAVLVERTTADADLVAALQFESPDARAWGSTALESAVIDDVAMHSRWTRAPRDPVRGRLARRLLLLTMGIAVWFSLAWAASDHVAVFLQRFFLLADRQYPTDTKMESITINGQAVDPAARGETASIYVGRPVRFAVRASGELPASGVVDLSAVESGNHEQVELKQASSDPAAYTATLDRLAESLEFRIHLGDARSRTATIEVVPLPIVEVSLKVEPPSDVSAEVAPPQPAPGVRQISVIEGSRVDVHIHSDQPLRDVRMTIDELEFPLRSDDDRRTWTISAADSPLAQVRDAVRFSIEPIADDGLPTGPPQIGAVRLLPDDPPRVAAGVVTDYVLPTARPRIYFQAVDDRGIDRVTAAYEIVHPDGSRTLGRRPLASPPDADRPLKIDRLDRGAVFDLAPLELSPGDMVQLRVKAHDRPGDAGKSGASETITLHVTDEAGIWARMALGDRTSADALKQMILDQLSVGQASLR